MSWRRRLSSTGKYLSSLPEGMIESRWVINSSKGDGKFVPLIDVYNLVVVYYKIANI